MNSIRTLMDGILDYAGLYPPANLEMGPTVANFADYRVHPEGAMLSRLIVPVARFEEFERHAEGLLPVSSDPASDDCWVISALTSPAGGPDFAADLEAIEAFNERHCARGAGAVVVDTIECRAADAAAIDGALDRIPESIFPYFELDHHGDVRGPVAAMAGMDAGAKVRTGGITPDLHPTPTELARFIRACAGAEVPFKATAGLHHPLRHHAEAVGCDQFGFLNVFIAGCLAWWVGDLADADLEAILEARELSAFEITDDTVGWGGHRIDLPRIEEARERFAHGFGSCSFLEPLDDLNALDLLRPDPAAT